MKIIMQRILLLLALSMTTSVYAVGLKPGEIAPGFTLPALDGKPYSLEGLRKKGHVLLIFWATECVYCYAHIKDYNRITEQYRDRLTVAAINIAGEYEKEVRDYVSDNGLRYLVLTDRLKNLDVAESYAVVGTPTMVVVSPQGKIVYYGFKLPPLEKWLK